MGFFEVVHEPISHFNSHKLPWNNGWCANVCYFKKGSNWLVVVRLKISLLYKVTVTFLIFYKPLNHKPLVMYPFKKLKTSHKFKCSWYHWIGRSFCRHENSQDMELTQEVPSGGKLVQHATCRFHMILPKVTDNSISHIYTYQFLWTILEWRTVIICWGERWISEWCIYQRDSRRH